MTFVGIISAIFIFSLVIFVHELGHFVAAKLSGVQVNEFSMFMGPAIFKKQKGETLYAIRCIPIGGYCAMEGEDEDTDNPRSFQKAAWWKRLIILVAGSFMNLVIGFLLLLLVFSFDKAYATTVITQTDPGCTIVREEGIHVGDSIYEIDGWRTFTAADANLLLYIEKPTHDVTVVRNGEKITFNDYAMEKHEFLDEETNQKQWRYGIRFGTEPASFWGLISYTCKSTVSFIQQVFLSLRMLITGELGFSDMSGPVGIVHAMTDTATQSETFGYAVLNLLYFGGFIALNLAVMNMLPIPALDGGRCAGLLLTIAIETVTRKKLNPKYEGYVHAAGMILLLLAMAVIMFKDIFFIFKG